MKHVELTKKMRIAIAGTVGLVSINAIIFSLLFVETGEFFDRAQKTALETDTLEPFPVGVDAVAKAISEQPSIEAYLNDHLAQYVNERPEERGVWHTMAASVIESNWFQRLASPNSRVIVIWAGDRYETVVDNFGDILQWSTNERELFTALVQESIPQFIEGKFFPDHYVMHAGATPQEAATEVLDNFDTHVARRYTPEVAAKVPLGDTLTIASLIEREARDFTDMREISGVIWNRLFIDMPLQLDASLQYVRGSRSWEPKWWPLPRPADKFIDSPYNTYQNAGLPPTAISNPSPAAILAALNPRKTNCLYYFHDETGDFYCSETYEEHVEKLQEVFGQGQ